MEERESNRDRERAMYREGDVERQGQWKGQNVK